MKVLAKRSLWLILAWALSALLVDTPRTVLAQESDQPESDTQGAEEAEQEEEDRYAVPEDATPDELLKFIGEVNRPESRPTSPPEWIDFYKKSSQAKIEAAEKILSSSDANDQQKIAAIQAKLGAMTMLSNFQMSSPEEIAAFLEEAKQNASPEVAKTIETMIVQVERNRILGQLRGWAQRSPEERDELVAQARQSISENPLNASAVQFAARVADTIATVDQPQRGIELLDQWIAEFNKSEDLADSDSVKSLEALARRLNLPGNEIKIEGELLDGTQVDWESYRGKVVLVDFWATWCGPCRAEVPNILTNYEAYREKGFDVLGVSLDTDKSAVEQYVEAKQLPWKTLYSSDEEATGWKHPLAQYYAINAIPRAILVDADGKVVHMNARGNVLGEQLRQLLGEPAATEQADTAEDQPKKTASLEAAPSGK